MRREILVIACAVVLLGATAEGRAQEKPASGNPEAGRTFAERCAACHGPAGLSREAGVPHLAGQHAAYILDGLKAYASGQRPGERMQQAVAGLTDRDMADVAAYYAALPPFSARPPKPGAEAEIEVLVNEDPFAAARVATAACAGCHGEDGNTDIPGTPSLAGQRAPYLMAALAAYQDGTRTDPTMQAFVDGLTRRDMEDMAYFYAAMEPRRSDTALEGDPFAGVAVAEPCAGCHGEDGNSHDPKNPRLAGLDATYLVAAINAYTDESRKHDIMRSAVADIPQKDLPDLAAFYASKEPRALPIRKPLALAEWVERCARCHGPKGDSTDWRFPVLAGQDEAYLANAMKLYHGGERQNQMMFAMSFLMSESDIDKLAAYYARQRAQ